MTLILIDCFEKDFVIVSSDTRGVRVNYDENMRMVIDPDSPVECLDKVELLTTNVLISGGGIASICDEWKNFMKAFTKENSFLDECRQIFEDSLRHLNEGMKYDKVFEKYLHSTKANLYLTGFYRDGSTGYMTLTDGKIKEIKLGVGQELKTMCAPTGDLLDKQEELMDYSNSPYIFDSWFDTIRHHFALVQALASKWHPDEVSPVHIVYSLTKDENGETVCRKYDSDLTALRDKLA